MTTADDIYRAIEAGIGHDDQLVTLERGPHYLQLLFDQCDGVVAEVVSNQFLDGEAQLWPPQLARLAQLGWREPVETCDDDECTERTHPNHWRYIGAPVPSDLLTSWVVDTFTSVFACDLDAVELHTSDLSA